MSQAGTLGYEVGSSPMATAKSMASRRDSHQMSGLGWGSAAPCVFWGNTNKVISVMLGSSHVSPKHDWHRPFILLALSWALYSASACAQTQLATVFGTVTDPTGAVIPGADVTVSSTNTGLKRVGFTDINGDYHVAGLPPGIYTVRAEKDKFQIRVLEGVSLTSGAAIAINLSLRVGSVPQDVTVNANAAIDTTTSTVSETIAQRSLTDLPLNGHDLFKTAILEPGVSPTPSSVAGPYQQVVPANYKHAGFRLRRACSDSFVIELRGMWHKYSPR